MNCVHQLTIDGCLRQNRNLTPLLQVVLFLTFIVKYVGSGRLALAVIEGYMAEAGVTFLTVVRFLGVVFLVLFLVTFLVFFLVDFLIAL